MSNERRKIAVIHIDDEAVINMSDEDVATSVVMNMFSETARANITGWDMTRDQKYPQSLILKLRFNP